METLRIQLVGLLRIKLTYGKCLKQCMAPSKCYMILATIIRGTMIQFYSQNDNMQWVQPVPSFQEAGTVTKVTQLLSKRGKIRNQEV